VNNSDLSQIAAEFEAALVGHRFGRVFPLSNLSIAIDFRLGSGAYLFICAESGNPRTYLIKRRLKEIEKQSANPNSFFLGLRKRFSGAELKYVSKLTDERVLILEFAAKSETGGSHDLSLVTQLTGRSANIFVLDDNGIILDRLRDTVGDGQEIATRYAPPNHGETLPKRKSSKAPFVLHDGKSLSEKLDEYYLAKESEDRFRSQAESARKRLRGEITKKRKLAEKLQGDLDEHGNAEQWKRFGDLLLANAANAKREEDRIIVTDFYDETTPEIEIAGDSNSSISEVAEKYFKRYTKARNAATEIARRMAELDTDLSRLQKDNDRLEKAIADHDESYFFVDEKRARSALAKRKKKKGDFNGARSFASSEGYEILVGKKAKDNDYLTFRVAKSLDLWLHAADYPGSHVVVRNPNRKDVPHKTLLEAAQLAAFYSDAREQPRAAVNYTQKKFVHKPRGAAPGLVRLASFKTVLVVPQVPENKNAA
jgi:predicted ribosome quality control (RQC) complex YloA/Tae2 family protein